MEQPLMIKIDHVSKEYRLGAYGGRTLKNDIQSWFANLKGKDDPNSKIGSSKAKKGKYFLALDDISLEVRKGERLGIIGHNGAGKSTLLKLLCRVTAPTNGDIKYNGRIASMLEVGTGFHPELTGRENVYLNGAILGMPKKEIDSKFDSIVKFAELEKFIDTPVKRYSSGMYVKLAFAVAAHLDSEIMIMDEVLAVGDMKFQKKCLGKMDDVSKGDGRTILYVSHNMSTIRQLCSRCIVMSHGQIIFDGDVDEAISIYLGIKEEVCLKYDYPKDHHKFGANSARVTINSLQLLDTDDSIYSLNEKIHCRLTCNSEADIEDIRFRFEVHYKDSTLAGTMFTEDAVVLKKGTNVFDTYLDTSHLVSGKYYVDIVAYLSNELGIQEHLDGVYPGFTFELKEEIDESNHLIWIHNYWGHVQLNSVQMKRLNQK